jgi:hypothetical protein
MSLGNTSRDSRVANMFLTAENSYQIFRDTHAPVGRMVISGKWCGGRGGESTKPPGRKV